MSSCNTPMNFKEMRGQALSRVEDILDRLNIDWVPSSKERINIICPVHQSTDFASSCIYLSNGNYKCWSRGCDTEIGGNFIHLIKWSLSQGKETLVSWEDVYDFINEGGVAPVREVKEFVPEEITYMDPNNYPRVIIPSQYYIGRGFSAASLKKFEIGMGEKFPWNTKSVVPIKSEDGRLMGFSARSIYDKCDKCKFHHSRYEQCISKDHPYASMYRKWYHSSGLKKTYTLYGIENVGTTDKIAIVEGPSCVWRLDQFDIPAVAVLGKSFSQRQSAILKSRGVTRIFLLTDEDEPGKEFRAKFIEEWHNVYQIYVTTLPKKDVSEMSDEQIKNTIVKKWEKI